MSKPYLECIICFKFCCKDIGMMMVHLSEEHFKETQVSHTLAINRVQRQPTIEGMFGAHHSISSMLPTLRLPRYYDIEGDVKKRNPAWSVAKVEFETQLRFGKAIEFIIQPVCEEFLGMFVCPSVDQFARHDFRVGLPGSSDALESKSTHSARNEALFNPGKVLPRPLGRLWLVYSNCLGSWILEFDQYTFFADFKLRNEPRWGEVYVVPVSRMTPLALFVT